ncbi:hypothetical protein L9F63_013128, partial [Diploptera punctata]
DLKNIRDNISPKHVQIENRINVSKIYKNISGRRFIILDITALGRIGGHYNVINTSKIHFKSPLSNWTFHSTPSKLYTRHEQRALHHSTADIFLIAYSKHIIKLASLLRKHSNKDLRNRERQITVANTYKNSSR